MYVQKLDSSGTDLWAADGVFVSQANSNYSYPRLALSDSNSIACVFAETSPADFSFQRIRDEESLTWSGYGIKFCDFNFIGTTYSDFSLMDDTNGCNVIFWGGGLSYTDVYGAKICSNGFLYSSIESLNTIGLSMFPNPAHNTFTIAYDETPDQISIVDLQGRVVKNIEGISEPGQISIDISGLNCGMYMIKVLNHERYYVLKCLKL